MLRVLPGLPGCAAARDRVSPAPGRPALGIGYRAELARWLDGPQPGLGCLEITAEHFYDGGRRRLAELARRWPLSVHGIGLSLGTPGPLDSAELDRFAAVADAAEATWVSEHVAFTRAGGIDLGHLNPVAPDRETLATLSRHAREVQEACGRRLLLENIATDLRLPGEMGEPEFLNALCAQSGCGLLLDLANLYVNSRNHRFDPRRWLDRLEPANVVQLHVVGYSRERGRYHDRHANAVQPEIYELLDRVAGFPRLESVIVERDRDLHDTAGLAVELQALAHAIARRG